MISSLSPTKGCPFYGTPIEGGPPELRRAIEDAGSVARESDPPGVCLGSPDGAWDHDPTSKVISHGKIHGFSG